MNWRGAVARFLRSVGLLRADLVIRTVNRMPIDSEIQVGELVLVKNGDVQKWACLKCPGGCGQEISLSLNPERRPRWSVSGDWFGRPNVEPSIHQTNACRCHFWIRRGQVDWCADGGPRNLR